MVLSRLLAKDGPSLITTANSHDDRPRLIAKVYKQIPNNHHTVRDKILGFHDVVVGDYTQEKKKEAAKR